MRKVESYKLTKNMNFFERIYKNVTNYKTWWYWNPKTNIGIDKIVVTNKVSFGRKGFKYFIGYKDDKKSDLYAYFSQKWVHIEETLMKLNVYLFE